MEDIIQKAIDGGYEFRYEGDDWTYDGEHLFIRVDYTEYTNLEAIIFDHSFLQAYFGEETRKIATYDYEDCEGGMNMEDFEDVPAWQWHAQQLVLSDDRIQYLRDNQN